MKDIVSRLKKLNEYHTQLKHLRGRHDQRDHNRWPAGYQAQGYIPVGGGRRAGLLANRVSGGLSSMTRRNVLASSATISDANVQQMKIAMNDVSKRPSRLLMARWLLGRGSSARFTATDVKAGRITQTQFDSLQQFKTPTRWEKGETFFNDIPRTTGPVTFDVLSRKNAYWQRSYTSALREYTSQGVVDAEAQTKAAEYADHISFLMSDESPMSIARDLASMHWIQSMLSVVPSVGHSAAKHDATAETLSGLRRVLSTVKSLWEKYKGGDVENSEPYFSEFFRDSSGLDRVTYDEASLAIEASMRLGKESVFGFLSSKFPEMRANTYDVLKQASNGYGVTRLPDALLRNPLDTEAMARLDAPYQNTPATTPSQFNADDFYSITGIPMVVAPKSSVDLMNAVDPHDNATYVQTMGRTEVDDVMLEDVMNRARELSQETGIPIEIVTAVLSYWQNGTQTISGYPVPTLVRLQDAAAELFGLELGPDGQRLNDYQQLLLEESDRVATGGRQWYSESNDSLQRTEIPIEHLFNDVFERDFEAQSEMEETRYLFMSDKTSDNFPDKYLTMSDEEIRKEYKKNADKLIEEKNKKTAAQLLDARQRYDAYKKQRALEEASLRIASSAGVPSTPYSTPQEARKAFLAHVYKRTQEKLKEDGIGPTTLYRGVSLTRAQVDALQDKIREETGNKSFSLYNENGEFNPSALVGTDVNLPRNALESWTADLIVADSIGANIDAGVSVSYEGDSNVPKVEEEPIIAEIVLGGTFNPERIVSTPATGFGQYREGEIVITGNREERLKVMGGAARVGKIGSRIIGTEANVGEKLTQRTKRGEPVYYYNPWGYSEAVDYVSDQVRRGIIEARTLMIKYFKNLGFN